MPPTLDDDAGQQRWTINDGVGSLAFVTNDPITCLYKNKSRLISLIMRTDVDNVSRNHYIVSSNTYKDYIKITSV